MAGIVFPSPIGTPHLLAADWEVAAHLRGRIGLRHMPERQFPRHLHGIATRRRGYWRG